jgi:hypothetical protein
MVRRQPFAFLLFQLDPEVFLGFGLAVGLCRRHDVTLPTWIPCTQPSIALAISFQWRLKHVSVES